MCDGRPYNTSSHVCWDNLFIRRKDHAHRYPNLCGDASLHEREELWYNPSEKRCCGNRQLYVAGETCCNGHVVSTPGTELGEGACCDDIGYNPKTHLCCQTTLYDIQSNEGIACCGQMAYIPRDGEEICCAGNRWPKTEEGMTCTGGVAHKPGQALCGNLVMDEDNEICCHGML